MDVGTAVGGSSASLGDTIGQMLGDIGSTPDETPESVSGTDTGTPPESPDAPETEAADVVPDGTEAALAERAGETPAAAAATPPTEGTPPPDADPLKDAKPATYTVDGQTRTYEGLKVLGEDGAVISADHLPDLLRRLGERDHLYEQNQRQFKTHQHLEQLATWKTQGPDGKEQTYTGAQGIVEARAELARTQAVLDAVDAVLSDPAKFAELVGVDDQNKIVVNPRALDYLRTQAQLSAVTAEQQVRGTLAQQLVQQHRPEPKAPDYAAAAPAVIQQAAGDQFKALTPEDTQFLAAQMKHYIRPTTEQERRTNPQQTHVVDLAFQQLVKDRIERRTSTAKLVSTASTAATENAARLAAAARGKPGKATPPKAKAPTVEQTRASDADQAWALRERLAAGRFTP